MNQSSQGPGTVIVVGSLNVDLVVGLDRMPEQGETVLGESLERHAGGKGLNQAIAASRLGADVRLLGAVGDDESGAWLRELIRADNVDDEGVATVTGPSGTALIEVDARGLNRIIVVPGANGHLSADVVGSSIRTMHGVAVVMTNGEVPLAASRAALAAGRAIGALTILNPAPVLDYREHLVDVDIFVPNEHEAAALSGLPTETDTEARAAAQYFYSQGIANVVITRGANGAIWASASGVVDVKTFEVNAIDTVAAGDAFCGGLAAALANGYEFADALKWASAAGALAVTIKGASPSLPMRNAVQNLLK
ncbi:MAG: ribokinase [Actinomycetes bacterium]